MFYLCLGNRSCLEGHSFCQPPPPPPFITMLLQGSTATAPSLQYWWTGTASSPQNPQHGSSAEVPGWHTAHQYHYTAPMCHFSLSNGCSHSPLSQHAPHCHMNISQKSLAKPPLRHQTHLSHLHITTSAGRQMPVFMWYLYYKLLLTARGVLWAAGKDTEQAEAPLPWQRGAGCCCPHRQSQTRPKDARAQKKAAE